MLPTWQWSPEWRHICFLKKLIIQAATVLIYPLYSLNVSLMIMHWKFHPHYNSDEKQSFKSCLGDEGFAPMSGLMA